MNVITFPENFYCMVLFHSKMQCHMINDTKTLHAVNTINHHPVNMFCPENVVCFLHLLNIFKSTQKSFTFEANTSNPDQTALKG